MPVFTSMPSARRRFATMSAVRTSRLLSSGCAWKSRRHSIVFGSTAFAAASIWAPVTRVIAAWAPLWAVSEIAIVQQESASSGMHSMNLCVTGVTGDVTHQQDCSCTILQGWGSRGQARALGE